MPLIDTLIPKLEGHLPDSIFQQLPETCKEFGIDGPLRLSNFLGQCQEETGSLTVFTENLNYSADRLWELFHTHFSSKEECIVYSRQPEKIANRIYANRMGNGPESSGDGWKYRGRGCIQLTGKNNYTALENHIHKDVVNNPDTVAHEYSLLSAGFYFSSNNLWSICDKGVTNDVIKELTHKVNGGEINLDKRIMYTQGIYKLLKS